ncbi:MAG: response regulator [Kangiellaceae bacterium]|nr:response regulator [Kangiellaceae bacterium]MCW9000241.1 response regulator [Kangiellaceae bacterium]MCW9017161.1 response regulator [Kangiellaceae bacterium]
MTKVLIVDDDENVCKSIERVLRRAGYVTEVANSGLEAVLSASQNLPDIITLDLAMPQIHGYKVLTTLREQEKYADIKILVISGVRDSILKGLLEQGANDVLAKPFENHELIDKIERLTQS